MQNENLGDPGPDFTPYFGIQTEGGRVGLVSCTRCGAVVIVGDKDFDGAAMHADWHRKGAR
jgi:hypothetical protein